jgi:hypothetical protein
MAYELLSGRRPFEPDNDSATSLILKVIQQPAEPMNTDMSRLLPDIESIVQRAMAKTPAERFQTADEMRAALVRFLDSSKARISAIELAGDQTVLLAPEQLPEMQAKTIPVSPLSSGEHSRSRKWLWTGGAAAAVVAGALLIAMPSKEVDPPADTNAAPAMESRAASRPAEGTAAATDPVPPPPVAPAPQPLANPPVKDPASDRGAATPSTLASAAPSVPAAVSAPAAKDMNAKEMFNDTDANVAPGLRFRLVQAGAGSAPMDVDPAKEFQTGDQVRFAFESNIDGYLYVAQQGTSGNWTVLFPNPDINGGRNAVKRKQEYGVPQGDWFRLDPPAGAEKIFVFLSREPLPSLPGFQRPVTEYGRGSAPMIASLQSSIASRDLVFTKDPAASKSQATYIVNKSEVGKAVTASFTITHK